jgi:hypothetical protein
MVDYKSVKPEYGFSSVVKTEGREQVNYMHVIALYCKLDCLQSLIEQHLEITSEKVIPLEFGSKNIQFDGKIRGVQYQVLIEYGACPTMLGGEGHRVEIRTAKEHPDGLSPIVAAEMKKYEIEMTRHIEQVEHALNSRY